MNRSARIMVVFLVGIVSQAGAQEGSVVECMKFTDPTLRLACYDAVFGQQNTDESAPEEPDGTVELQTTHEETQKVETPVVRPEEAIESMVEEQVVAEEAEPEAAPAPALGDEQVKRAQNRKKDQEEKAKKKKTKEGSDRALATIKSVTKRPMGERIFGLENGQVWVQLSRGYFPTLKPGDEVVIIKHPAGGYSLRSPGGRATRVRRVE